MRMSVKLKFNDAQGKIVDQFAREIGLSVDDFCKRAVFYSINDSYKRAELIREKMELQDEANSLKETKHDTNVGDITNAIHNPPTGIPATDPVQASSSEGIDSAALPNQTDENTNQEA